MVNPSDVENYFFRFRLYSIPFAQYAYYYNGYGALGLYIGQRWLATGADDPSISDYAIEYVPAFPMSVWDFSDTSLPSDAENYTWFFLAETNHFTGEWVPYGQNVIDGQAGLDELKPLVVDMRDYSDEHVRNTQLGYAPLITGWTTWDPS